ncbi:hypothetical protein niasHS_017282 [Heterodera schachtii]|uniref:Reverse transcriptase domain-containing protein n=1 Tax=Heterodera schachtii TaxID=97005 RepID=A0ABD2IA18_HETSC
MDKFGFLDNIKLRISQHGINSCRAIDQIGKHISELRKEFPSVFEDALGHCIKEKAHLELKGGVALPASASTIQRDIFATLNGGQFFSQIDLKDAYFQVELDEDSKNLCGLSTHKGNFAMERLPFGVKSAPSIFQSIMDKMLAGMNFATAYLDDIIVASRSFADHIQHLKDVFNRLQSYGFRVKMTKCSFFQEEIKYLGFVIDKNGRRPDASKIKAITEMPAPTNISTLRSFLGMKTAGRPAEEGRRMELGRKLPQSI